jgi:ABC-type branched-subunit amino acid transport system substrate-binding protein
VSFHLRILVLIGALSGCAALHHLDDYSTRHDSDEVTTPEVSAGPEPIGSVCGTHPDCPAEAACVAGSCVPLRSSECPRVHGEIGADTVLIGALTGDGSEERAIALAAEEVGRAARPLAVVACDPDSDVLRAAKHLTETLHLPAIVGPLTGGDVIAVTQQASVRSGTLLMTSSTTSAISNLADDNLTWRNVPSDVQRAKLLIQQVNELEALIKTTRSTSTVKLGIVHADTAQGVSARDSIAGKLILNGRFVSDAANAANVSIDAYDDALGASSIATRYGATFLPDIVLLSSSAEIESFIVPLEQALTAARVAVRPYYVCTEGLKTPALLAALSARGMPLDLKRRIRGIGAKPDAISASVLGDFVRAFTSRWGTAPGPSGSLAVARSAAAYDATYAIAYAIAATGVVSGASIARGLRALGVGDPLNVGAASAEQVAAVLRANRSVALRGTFAPMEWDPAGDVRAGAVEVWCLGGAASSPTFGSSGLTMDVANQVVGGSFVQCQ